MNTFSYKAEPNPPVNVNYNSVVQNFYSDGNPVIKKIKGAY